MILLSSDCLLFRLASGESIPLRPEMISIEVSVESESLLDAEFINHVAAAVFHYFKHEKQRDSVSLAEFAEALQGVLQGFEVKIAAAASDDCGRVHETDLSRIATEAGGQELFFFPKLRAELKSRLRQSPSLLRFRGLRGCVKELSGSRRWTLRCQGLRDQIIDYLRGCVAAEAPAQPCSLVVE